MLLVEMDLPHSSNRRLRSYFDLVHIVHLQTITTSATMSRPLVRLALSTRSRLPIASSHLSKAAIPAFTARATTFPLRTISTSPFTRLAQPTSTPTGAKEVTGPNKAGSSSPKDPQPIQSSTATKDDDRSRATAVQGDGSTVNVLPQVDYSKGPSALDKASQLFFFTEIVRGGSLLLA